MVRQQVERRRQPGLAREQDGAVARAQERQQRVAGEEQVGQRPQHGAGECECRQLRLLAPRLAAQLPRRVRDRQQPRLGPEQAGDREQREHERRRSATPARRPPPTDGGDRETSGSP